MVYFSCLISFLIFWSHSCRLWSDVSHQEIGSHLSLWSIFFLASFWINKSCFFFFLLERKEKTQDPKTKTKTLRTNDQAKTSSPDHENTASSSILIIRNIPKKIANLIIFRHLLLFFCLLIFKHILIKKSSSTKKTPKILESFLILTVDPPGLEPGTPCVNNGMLPVTTQTLESTK